MQLHQSFGNSPQIAVARRLLNCLPEISVAKVIEAKGVEVNP
jgi:hypothetical protein